MFESLAFLLFLLNGGGVSRDAAAATPVETGVMDVSLCSGAMALAAAARLEALAKLCGVQRLRLGTAHLRH